MEGLDFWRLCDELTVAQAALLIAGEDPSVAGANVERWVHDQRPVGYEAAKHAVSAALRKERIEGYNHPEYEYDINGNPTAPIEGTTDPIRSRVDVASLKLWLKARGLSSGFFFPTLSDRPDYLDPTHARYAPKLAAAVLAWQDCQDQPGKTAKQTLVKWLREHAAKFGLSDDEGKPNEQGIEECAKVANWQPGGGAPKTPG